jgi:hypothetical protein
MTPSENHRGEAAPQIARWLAAAAATVCLATAANAHGADATPAPGYWETTSTSTLLFSSTSVDRKCFTAADVSKVLQGPSNRHYTCTYPTRVVGGGKIRLKGTCVTKRGQVANVTAQGVYTPTTFHLSANLDTNLGGLPIAGTATTDARRIADACPIDLPPPPAPSVEPQQP